MTNDSSRLYDALEVCLVAMSTGVDLDACLKLYPDLAADLRPALITARRARQLAPQDVPEAGMKRSRGRMLAKAEELNTARRPFFLRVAPRLAMTALALILVLVLSLNGLAVASAQSLPGDVLYPVKRAAENVSLELARTTETRLKMEESYQQRRATEIHTLLSEKRVHRVSFEGVIDEVNPEGVVVQGIPVALNLETLVIGELLPGRLVEVEGTTQADGQVDADEMHLRFYEYSGQLNDIQPGLWTIGDAQFKLLRETHLDPTLRVGEQVLVLVYSSDDGSLYAQSILRVPEALVIDQDSFEPFEIEFSGALQSISGDSLVIDGKTVKISDQSEVKGDFTIGTLLKVHAIVAEDGSLTAREIEAGAGDSSGEGQSREDHSEESSDSDDQAEETKSGDDSSGEDSSSEDDSSDDEQDGEKDSGDENQSDDDGSGEDASSDDDDHSGGENSGGDESSDSSGSGSSHEGGEEEDTGSGGEENQGANSGFKD